MELKTEKIYLRPITAEDTEMVLRWRNSDGVKKYYLYRKDITPAEHGKWLAEKVGKGLVYQFIIVTRDSDTPIGSVYIQHIDRDNRNAEFGIFIGEDAALGHGYGTEAARLIVRFAFCELGLHKLYLRVLSDNIRAIRSYARVGFSTEGDMKDEVCIDGKFYDVTRMSILHADEIGE